MIESIRTQIAFFRFATPFIHSFIHSFFFAFNKKYNNSIQKYIKDNIQYSNLIFYKIKSGGGKEAYIEARGS